MKILISGGHFSPALSVIEKLRSGQHEVLVVGRKTAFEGDTAVSFEYKVCQELGIPFKEIRTGRLQRALTQHTVPSLLKLPLGFGDAVAIIRTFKPDIVLTFGGYLSLPVAFAAYSLRVPVVVHEQTQHAGLANKIISKFAAKVCISFESSRKYFSLGKIIHTGNPIRQEIFEVKKKLENKESLPIIYITGGSTGAHALNMIVAQIIEKLVQNYFVIHQSGDSMLTGDFEKLEKIRSELPKDFQKRYLVKKYIMPDEIGWVLQHAQLIIGRAGMNTVTELLALGKSSLLIPLPHGQKGEQLENAKLIKKTGIGDYFLQDDLTASALYSKIEEMIKNKNQFEIHKKDAESVIFIDATDRILNVIQSVYEKKTAKTISIPSETPRNA